MTKVQVKRAQETVEKVKKDVAKKVKVAKSETRAVVNGFATKAKAKAKAVLVKKANEIKNGAIEAGKAKVAETADKLKTKTLDRLHAHAMKHVSNWHVKAGEDGPAFAKLLAKHARALLK